MSNKITVTYDLQGQKSLYKHLQLVCSKVDTNEVIKRRFINPKKNSTKLVIATAKEQDQYNLTIIGIRADKTKTAISEFIVQRNLKKIFKPTPTTKLKISKRQQRHESYLTKQADIKKKNDVLRKNSKRGATDNQL